LLIPGGGIASQIVIRLGARQKRVRGRRIRGTIPELVWQILGMRRCVGPTRAGYGGWNKAAGDSKRLGEECLDPDRSSGIDSMKSLRSGTRGTRRGRAARSAFDSGWVG